MYPTKKPTELWDLCLEERSAIMTDSSSSERFPPLPVGYVTEIGDFKAAVQPGESPRPTAQRVTVSAAVRLQRTLPSGRKSRESQNASGQQKKNGGETASNDDDQEFCPRPRFDETCAHFFRFFANL